MDFACGNCDTMDPNGCTCYDVADDAGLSVLDEIDEASRLLGTIQLGVAADVTDTLHSALVAVTRAWQIHSGQAVYTDCRTCGDSLPEARRNPIECSYCRQEDRDDD